MTAKPAVAFVAEKSGAGKTTLLVEVLKVLKKRGHRVGTVKHALHEIQLDREGTDSWRHAQAGSDVCVLAGPGFLATVRRLPKPMLEDALAEASLGTDIVLVEGFKNALLMKIEVYRSGHSDRLLCEEPQGKDMGIVAVASDVPLEVSIPVLPLNDPVEVCDFIVERFLNKST